MFWIFLENFPPWSTASFTRHSTHYSTKSRSNWLQSQQSLPQYIAIKHVTISSGSPMSLLRHNHGSTIPGWLHYFSVMKGLCGGSAAVLTLQTSGARRKCSRGGFIQWHMVVICIWCAVFVTSQVDVIFVFPNQRFSEVC